MVTKEEETFPSNKYLLPTVNGKDSDEDQNEESNVGSDARGIISLEPKPTTFASPKCEIVPLSGNPYFISIMAKSSLKPNYQLVLPVKCCQLLPLSRVPMVLSYGEKSWEMAYQGDFRSNNKRFSPAWRIFAVDNDLKMGDACIFELMDRTPIVKFRVQILRGQLPPGFVYVEGGHSSNSPIIIDD
eukprot:TRINITY_DN26798_c0_g1_i1.p1 TRINITY_DN26798_c0_g1~~TRINITY_DN26798_c0_g1_i1.p1  ORF type:complete len:186 (+),score=38.01 TRINITY_DN26798_c0_g1_i1:65-622(+)